jgi:hypothetical protein
MTETSTSRPLEREPFGITYDRLRVDRLLTHLVRKHNIRTALELPADGSKAMPGIYSLALARAGVHVTLFNPEAQGVAVWERLGLMDRVTIVEGDDPMNTGLEPRQFDLVWNFVSAAVRPGFANQVQEMNRLSNRWVMTVHMNGFNWGFPWHRFLHKAFKLRWTHGETENFFPSHVRKVYRSAGLEPVEFGLLDMPWWPDPPGFRDVRLHLEGRDDVTTADWTAPIEEVYASGQTPLAGRVLGRIEDAPIPRPVRFVFSHLFYQLGERILR